MGAIKFITGLIIFLCMLFLTYVTTRYVGKKAANSMKSKHMKVLESISLGVDKNVYLVQVGAKCVLIACSGKNIQYLGDVEADLLSDTQQDETPAVEDSSIFAKYLNKILLKEKEPAIFESASRRSEAASEENSNYVNMINHNVAKMKEIFDKLKKNGRGGDEKIDA